MGNGIPGPMPKREAERRRNAKTTESGVSNAVQHVVVDPAVMDDTSLVKCPAPNPEWHPVAMMQYEAARRSAIREFFEPTDWSVLFVLCEQLSSHLRPQPIVIQSGPEAGTVIYEVVPMNGATLNAVITGLTNLMFTEGARRRLRIEVERVAGSAAARVEATATGENVIQLTRERRLSS